MMLLKFTHLQGEEPGEADGWRFVDLVEHLRVAGRHGTGEPVRLG